MAKADLGQKRSCTSCGMRFFDFNRKPITCPGCGTEFDPENLLKPSKARAAKAADKIAEASTEDDAALEDAVETSFDDGLDGGAEDTPESDGLDYDDGEADEEDGGLIQDNIAPDDELLTNIPSGEDE